MVSLEFRHLGGARGCSGSWVVEGAWFEQCLKPLVVRHPPQTFHLCFGINQVLCDIMVGGSVACEIGCLGGWVIGRFRSLVVLGRNSI